MNKSGADIVLECLLEQGVDTVFGYPGGTILNIYDSIYKYSDKIGIYSLHTNRARRTRPTVTRGVPARSAFVLLHRDPRDQPHNRHRYSVWTLSR